MCKRFLSLALSMLMIFSILSCPAFADQYITLGNVNAGSSINVFITQLPAGSVAGCDNLPLGCTLQTGMQGDSVLLHLGGLPTQAGHFDFTINASLNDTIENISCSLDILPAPPISSPSGNINCFVGEDATLSAIAYTTDGGTLSYQWFSSTGGSTSGGTLLPDATRAEYQADTSKPGISYYYCQITNENCGLTSTIVSPLMSVNVSEAYVDSVMINTLPNKTKYMLGETLDTSGLSLVVRYSNGSQQVINSGFTVTPYVLTSSGSVPIEVVYNNKSCSFPVNVGSLADSISSVSVISLPDKTEYQLGDVLDTGGLKLRAYTADGQMDISDGFTCSPSVLNSPGRQTITVTYFGKTCTFDINVKDKAPTAPLLEVVSTPKKLIYELGEALDTAGLVLRSTVDGQTSTVSAGFTCTPDKLTQAGSQTILVKYGNQTCSFSVDVKETGTSAPDDILSDDPSPTPHIIPHESHRSKNKGVLIAIMVVAMLCLVGLGVYMLIMRAGGLEEFSRDMKYRIYKIKNIFRRK